MKQKIENEIDYLGYKNKNKKIEKKNTCKNKRQNKITKNNSDRKLKVGTSNARNMHVLSSYIH